ncbi:MAG: glycosyltransferase family 2 protein [Firmicutes bacterium]|nr:glycosyltransferase family 2 protein [Bacillota bacterium]
MGVGAETEARPDRHPGVATAAAVIPAYNEEATIGPIVEVLCATPSLSEVVVVSDGSEDRTAEVARRAGARVIELPFNMGKGAAMREGLRATTAEVVVFLDADLVGLTSEHVAALLEPVLRGQREMSIGLFEGGRALTDLAQAITPNLSGQRAVRRRLLEQVQDIDAARFGVEIALTRYLKRAGIEPEEVILRNVTHRTKEEKLGLVKGFAARMRMYWEIVRYLP